MKLVVQTQLLPDTATAKVLRITVERFNAACNWVAGIAFERQLSNRISLQGIVYRDVRERFGLSAQMTCLRVRRVCEAYKRDKSIRPEFRKHAAMPFDLRTMSFKGIDRVSLLTLDGRVVVPLVLGSDQAERIASPKGRSDLVRRKDGKWFLLVTVDVPEGMPIPVTDFIGVDLGVKNLAVTDDGTTFSGDGIEACRRRSSWIRETCQRTGTKSAKRKLRKAGKTEGRFRKDWNHCVAKAIAAKAKDAGSAIACEDLAGIGERTTVRKPERNRMKGWAFHQLRCFLTYKAALAGVFLLPVDPRNTSRTCSECSHCETRNRKSRDEFECRDCGFALPEDHNAARNIRNRALRDWADVGQPTVGLDDAGLEPRPRVLTSPQALAVGH
ncbi:MAG TPA: transposase [Isosphaeraceae bacterium]|jgi:IS605 OrfB family transposase